MLNILCFILAVYGISNMLVYAEGPFHIFDKYRKFMKTLPSNLGDSTECMICTPTIVGIVISLIDLILVPNVSFTPMSIIMGHWYYFWLIVPLDGAIGSAGSWLIDTIQTYIEAKKESLWTKN